MPKPLSAEMVAFLASRNEGTTDRSIAIGPIHKRVLFQSQIFWLNWEVGDDQALLSPLSHFASDDLLVNPFHPESWAIIDSAGLIWRHRKNIGTVDDLEEVTVIEITAERRLRE